MFLHVVMLPLSGAADTRFHDRVQGYCDRILDECDGGPAMPSGPAKPAGRTA